MMKQFKEFDRGSQVCFSVLGTSLGFLRLIKINKYFKTIYCFHESVIFMKFLLPVFGEVGPQLHHVATNISVFILWNSHHFAVIDFDEVIAENKIQLNFMKVSRVYEISRVVELVEIHILLYGILVLQRKTQSRQSQEYIG